MSESTTARADIVGSSEWFAHVRRCASPRLRLFCLPPAGADASFFSTWSEWLLDDIELYPMQLPAHGRRMGQPPIRSMAVLVEQVSTAILSMNAHPCVLFGHSMGALVSVEVARVLRIRSGLSPVAVIVSACSAPPHHQQFLPVHRASSDTLWKTLAAFNGVPRDLLDNAEYRALFEPAIRADFEILETYEPLSTRVRLECPIHVFAGERDPFVPAARLADWQVETTRPLTTRIFPGDHFYLRRSTLSFFEQLNHLLWHAGSESS